MPLGLGVESHADNRLRCTPPPGPDPFDSAFTMEFTPSIGTATIEHQWQCGDVAGTYSRHYRTHAPYTMPLFCLDNSICYANRHTVKGLTASFKSPRSTTPSMCRRPPARVSQGVRRCRWLRSGLSAAFGTKNEGPGGRTLACCRSR